MNAAAFLASPWGGAVAIAGMAAVTALCRIAGMVLMSHVRITPRVERGLRALPGSILMATILPITVDSGPQAIAALAVAIATMALTRIDILSLVAGLGALAVIRAFL